jgi:ATP/maltotriose-dependent transcriptional regulator MalT
MTERRHERPLRAETLLVEAHLLHARGELESATVALEETRALAESSEDILMLARTLVVLGDVWHERGERSRAYELWQEGLAGFTRLGAIRETEKLQQRLASPGGGNER